MARITMLLGPPGTGKTYSLRNLPPNETVIMKASNKPLGWRGHKAQFSKELGNMVVNKDLAEVEPSISQISDNFHHIKYVVIDDFFFLMSNIIFSPEFLGKNSGNEAFSRYTELAASVYQALFQKEDEWRDDLNIIVTNHTQVTDTGMETIKMPGKLIEKDIAPESMVTYLLHSVVQEKDGKFEYKFLTNRTTSKVAKTPVGLFSNLYIDNDIYAVLKAIDAFDMGEEVKLEKAQ